MQTPVQKRRDRSFFTLFGRALDAQREFERLNMLSDKGLAARNLTREGIAQHVLSRL